MARPVRSGRGGLALSWSRALLHEGVCLALLFGFGFEFGAVALDLKLDLESASLAILSLRVTSTCFWSSLAVSIGAEDEEEEARTIGWAAAEEEEDGMAAESAACWPKEEALWDNWAFGLTLEERDEGLAEDFESAVAARATATESIARAKTRVYLKYGSLRSPEQHRHSGVVLEAVLSEPTELSS